MRKTKPFLLIFWHLFSKAAALPIGLEEMDGSNVPCAPINDFAEILRDPHVQHMGLVKPLDLPNGAKTNSVAFPIAITGVDTGRMQPPPALGAHNDEIIADWLGK